VLTQEEIKTLYNTIPNTYTRFLFAERQVKQYELRLIFDLYYACGLRLSEGYKLKIQDIDFDKKRFCGTGKKLQRPHNTDERRRLQRVAGLRL